MVRVDLVVLAHTSIHILTPICAAVSAVRYRLIGNDMPPLESLGQLRRNTAFALEQEPAVLLGTRRRWILNRISSASESAATRLLLRDHGYGREDILELPFDAGVMCALPNKFQQLRYATNQNGARNAAYRQARANDSPPASSPPFTKHL